MTSLAKIVASIAKITLQHPNDNLVRDLESDSQTLDRIRDGFSRILHKCTRTLTVWSFVEELALPVIGEKVSISTFSVYGAV
jgi:protein SERAC1